MDNNDDEGISANQEATIQASEIDETVDIEDLNFTFGDEEESFVASIPMSTAHPSMAVASLPQQPSCAAAASNRNTDDGEDLKKSKAISVKSERGSYILGTLVIRVVAARDLEAVDRGGGGLGNLLFGGGGKSGAKSSSGGTANPYATVRFGKTTQRTSEAHATTDPIWPRGEIMYMDVMHPSWESDLDDYLSRSSPSKPHKNYGENFSTVEVKYQSPPKPILTVAIFHASQVGRVQKYPNKSGDSEDTFLGMTSIDLTQLLTGKVRSFDEWLPLQGSTATSKASVRVVCEYEASDAPPLPGDLVKFTDFCHPTDLYPAVQVGRVYSVHQVEGDEVLISWTSLEGWVSSFLVHRFMLICIERHQSVVSIYQDELASIRERIAYSPMVNAVQETVERVPDEGLLGIGAETLQNGVSLLSRWWENGFETTAQDLTFATNWDGRHNPSAESLAAVSDDSNHDQAPLASGRNDDIAILPTPIHITEADADRLGLEPPLPNMPPCPITGEPMRDPVVAADGHTYERSAIARWLSESNKSPLTGAVLPHKDLVPNYMLLSSLQEAAAAAASRLQGDSKKVDTSAAVIDVEEDTEMTLEVNIND
jgi:U-box domain/C2 domain